MPGEIFGTREACLSGNFFNRAAVRKKQLGSPLNPQLQKVLVERKTSPALYDSELGPPWVSASPYPLNHLSFTITIHFEDSAEGFNFFLRWSSELAAKQKNRFMFSPPQILRKLFCICKMSFSKINIAQFIRTGDINIYSILDDL
jgi:hypothetical protein